MRCFRPRAGMRPGPGSMEQRRPDSVRPGPGPGAARLRGRLRRRLRGPVVAGVLILWAAALPWDGAYAAEELYRSDPTGAAIARITEAEREDHRYVLEVEAADDLREHRLYREGELLREERQHLDAEGRVVSEERVEGGEHRETDHFDYDGQGRIRRVTRERDGETVHSTSYAYADGRLFEEAYRSGARVTVARFDTRGRVAYRAERREGELLREEEYRYTTAEDYTVRIREDETSGLRVERYEEKRLRESRLEEDGRVLRRSVYRYDGENLREVITEGEQIRGRRVAEHEYDEDGELRRRIVREDDRIIRETSYRDSRERVETVYRGGVPFLRITYRDDNVVARELVSGE
ncbi:MAG: hypothetical protein ACLFSP_01275 [Spirochaetaceae bacterium]